MSLDEGTTTEAKGDEAATAARADDSGLHFGLLISVYEGPGFAFFCIEAITIAELDPNVRGAEEARSGGAPVDNVTGN